MGYPSDVPVHRPSVGAMGWSGSLLPAKITRPYVYRGTGRDALTGYLDQPTPAEREAVRVKRAADKELERLQRKAARELERERAKRRRERERRKREAMHEEAQRNWRREQERRRQQALAQRMEHPAKRRFSVAPEPPEPPPAKPRHPRPAPGWKPLTGADVEDILNELEVE